MLPGVPGIASLVGEGHPGKASRPLSSPYRVVRAGGRLQDRGKTGSSANSPGPVLKLRISVCSSEHEYFYSSLHHEFSAFGIP